MTDIKRYKPVGGVISAELFAVGGIATADDLVAGQGVAVELVDDGSQYEESAESDNTLVSVKHTLTLCSDRWLAAAWFDKEFMQRAAADGVAARITMATGEEIVVGWSERFGFEQPLRLKTLTFCSGSKPNDSPRVVLTLSSRDTDSAIK
jgi:hypothetical protein